MNIRKEIEEEFGKDWQDKQREQMVRIQFPETIKRIEERVRLEERKKTLEEVEDGINNIQYGAEVQGNTMIDIKHIEEVLSKLKSK